MKKEDKHTYKVVCIESDFNLKSSQNVLGKYSDFCQSSQSSHPTDSDIFGRSLRQLQLQIQFRTFTGFLFNPRCGTKDGTNVVII